MSQQQDFCPDCFRMKAHSASHARLGYCPKWYAIRDPEAAEDCREIADRINRARPAPPTSVAAAGLDGEIADAARVIAWVNSAPRKPAVQAFTAGAERQAAYWIEWAENRAQQALRQHLQQGFDQAWAQDQLVQYEGGVNQLIAAAFKEVAKRVLTRMVGKETIE